MKIYVDSITGTWGMTQDLIMLEITDKNFEFEYLDNMSDGRRVEWALNQERATE